MLLLPAESFHGFLSLTETPTIFLGERDDRGDRNQQTKLLISSPSSQNFILHITGVIFFTMFPVIGITLGRLMEVAWILLCLSLVVV